jgi:hypothetical protein
MNLFAASTPPELIFVILFVSFAYCIYKAKQWAKKNPAATGAVKNVILDQIKKKLGG